MKPRPDNPPIPPRTLAAHKSQLITKISPNHSSDKFAHFMCYNSFLAGVSPPATVQPTHHHRRPSAGRPASYRVLQEKGDLVYKALCKSIRKDGSPCQGHGLEQFDGYCIAHGPADKVRQWRSRGGKNSATAARLDKRIPDRLKNMMDMLEDGMTTRPGWHAHPRRLHRHLPRRQSQDRPIPPRR